MTVDLNTFRPGDWFKLRSGTLMRIASLEKSGAPFYPFRIDDGIVYTAEGRYMGSKEHPWDIVRIIPADRITVTPAPAMPEVSDQEATIAALYGRLRSIDGIDRGPVMPAELEFHRQQLIRQRMGVM